MKPAWAVRLDAITASAWRSPSPSHLPVNREPLRFGAARGRADDAAGRAGFAAFGRGEALVVANSESFHVFGAGDVTLELLVASVADARDRLVARQLTAG